MTQQSLASAMKDHYQVRIGMHEGEKSQGDDWKSAPTIPLSLQKLVIHTVARSEAAKGRFDDAIKLFQRLLDIESGEQKIYQRRLCTALEHDVLIQEAEVLCDLGQCYLNTKDLEAASSAISQAINVHSDNDQYARALRLKSELWVMEGKASEALQTIQESLKSAQSLPMHERKNEIEHLKCLWQYGVVKYNCGLVEDALSILSDAVKRAERAFGYEYVIAYEWRNHLASLMDTY